MANDTANQRREVKRLQRQIQDLSRQPSSDGSAKDLETLRRRLDGLRRESSAELTSWHRVQLSRHPRRPHVQDFIELIFSDFSPLHGDRRFADDPAMIGGMARFHGEPCIILGTQKGRDTEQKLFRNFGMPKPEGYRKALRLMQLAQKFDRPIFIFIDTAGAYPGIGAEERGQAEAIAQNLREMARLTVPVLVTITGEGGSGGALGIGIGDRVYMLEHAYYSVISPEGCAAILWKDQSRVEDAANALKITSSHLKRLGIVDEVIPEPEGGAHNDPEQTAASVDRQLKEGLKALKSLSAEQLVLQRSRRFRVLGDASPLSDPPPDSVSRP
ncbi:MAG: acetyl-CoA carboxylase carboxyltransferase subunit alpha [Acidobacteriota bacterium]|nr:acetyl-CoA carboxylase carboxyltransferase subunit alpha [Acidobacteriota bacterium]